MVQYSSPKETASTRFKLVITATSLQFHPVAWSLPKMRAMAETDNLAKSSMPGFHPLPPTHDTRTAWGPLLSTRLAGLSTTDSGGLWQGIEERGAEGMSSAWWGPGRDSEQRFESGVVGTQFFQKNAARQGTTDYG